MSSNGHLTFKTAREACRVLGFTLSANAAEYRLALPGTGNEASAYYTNDLADALATARVWFHRLNSNAIKHNSESPHA